jgi:hypothetical protein
MIYYTMSEGAQWWLKYSSGPFDSKLIAMAVYQRNVKALNWLIVDNLCPGIQKGYELAKREGFEDIVEYFESIGCSSSTLSV